MIVYPEGIRGIFFFSIYSDLIIVAEDFMVFKLPGDQDPILTQIIHAGFKM